MNYMIRDAENVQHPPTQCGLIQDGNSLFYMNDAPQTMKTVSSPAVYLLQLEQHSAQTLVLTVFIHQNQLRGIVEVVVNGL